MFLIFSYLSYILCGYTLFETTFSEIFGFIQLLDIKLCNSKFKHVHVHIVCPPYMVLEA